MLVSPDAATREARRRRGLPGIVEELQRIGLKASYANGLAVDVVWSVDGKPCMFDLKTAEDAIASVNDGRLHNQMEAMKKANCLMFGFIIEGEWGQDGITVGHASHAWAWERLDNLFLSIQLEGGKILRSPRLDRTPQRLASLYRYSGRDDHGSWHAPQPHHNLHNAYTDKDYRRHVEALMSWPDMGEERANNLLDRYSYMEINGITPESLLVATERWKDVRGIGPKITRSWETFLLADFSKPRIVPQGLVIARS